MSNCTLGKVVEDESFRAAMEWLRKGWVFKTHFSNEFPHFAGDFEPFSSGLSTMLRNHFPDKSHPHASLNTDTRRKLDLKSVEVWRVETTCVSFSFPENYSHDATLRPKQFVHDFPLRLWLFPPPRLDPATSHVEPVVYPKVSFLLHLPQPLHVTLERLQFLFLLDVKESFRNFQSTLIQLLTLGNRSSTSQSGNISPSSEPNTSNPSTTTISTDNTATPSTITSTATNTSTTTNTSTDPTTTTSTDTSTTKGTDNGTQSFKNSASMGGCIVVNTVNIEILLPTLFGSGGGSPEAEQRTNAAGSEAEMFMELESKAKDDSAPLHRPSSMTSLLASGDKSSASSPFPDEHTPDMPRGTTNLKRSSSATSILSSSQAASSPFGSTANLSTQHNGQDDDEQSGDLQPLSEDVISVADSDETCPPSIPQTSVPSSQTSMSLSQGSMAPSQGSVPPSQDFMPPSQGSMPPSQGSISPSQGSMPPSQGSVPPSQGSMPPSQGSMPPSQGSMPPSHTFTSLSQTSIVTASVTAPAFTHVSSTSAPLTTQVTKATTGTPPTPSPSTPATPLPLAPQPPTPTHVSMSPLASSLLPPASNNPKPSPPPSVFTEDSDFVMILTDPLSSSATEQLSNKQEPCSQDAYPQRSTFPAVVPSKSASFGGVVTPPPSQAVAPPMNNRLAPLTPLVATPTGLDAVSTHRELSPSLATPPESVPTVGQISSDTNSGPPAISNSDLSSQTDVALDTISVSTETSSSNNIKSRVPKPPIHGKTQGYVAPPPYVLLVHVENACLLPNVTPKGISLRGSVDYMELEEAKAGHRPRNVSPVPSDSPDECVPVVKIRFELGDRVGNLFPGTSPPPKTAAMIKVDGLDASFWVPNLTYLKDFFEDEYVTNEPLPVHVRVDNTSVVMRDSAGDTADNPHSLRIQVHGVCVHRGPRLEGVHVFAEDSAPVSEEEERVVAGGNGEGNGLLKEMFKSFISAFDVHIQKFGEVKLPYANHIAGLLYQLKSSLSGEPPGEERTDAVSVAHPRWYKMSSVQTELQRLRKENENLRKDNENLSKYEEENRRLTQQLVDVMVELVKIKSENTWLVSEVRTKQDLLITYKQLIEKQHTQIENLVSDRDNLTAEFDDTQAQSMPH